ncbi:MAG TPA: class I SAM-dependent methyltransferase [Gemmataceae bacterium]|nr:class I SAM-dependent methyltransferase [Gemmataceae bacterium]
MPVRDWFTCPRCGKASLVWSDAKSHPACAACGFVAGGSRAVFDLESGEHEQTDAHYTLQWGRDKAFFDFLSKQPAAKAIMPAGQMGWPALFDEIRTKAKAGGPIHVYDAACGFGGITRELVNDETAAGIRYVGADIHHSLDLIAEKVPALAKCGMLLRWDVSNPLPTNERFDYIICRAAIHHTPNPRKTFTSLVSRLKPGGQIAITVYRKKSIAREALDDAYRHEIVPMDPEAAFAVSRQFTVLGQALQQIDQKVSIPEDLPLFDIKAGEHKVQMLFYNHFLKCFFNPVFGDEYSTLVNYDWYHPRFAYRYHRDEIQKWFDEEGLKVTGFSEIEAQMYFAGTR